MSEGASPEIRLSDADRDEVVGQLSLALGEGRLDLTEFEERSRKVYAAKVGSDLDGVLDDLPVTTTLRSQRAVATRQPPSDRRRWFVALLGDRKHRGALDLGRRATSIQLLGDTTFDLTEVVAREVDLRVFSMLGDITLVVPPGARVDIGAFLLLGDREDHVPHEVVDDPLHVRFRAVTLLGDIKVRVKQPG